MRFVRHAALVVCFLGAAGGLAAQEPAKKAEPKEATKPEAKVKGYLPQNWAKLGLTDDQRTKVYQIQGKYKDEIDKLEAQIKTLKEKMARERLEVLTPEQKKRLSDIVLGAVGTGDK